MSESNKTEKPTPKKLQDAKKEGNHRFSDAVVTFATTFFGVLVCYVALADIPQRFDRALQAAIVLGNNPDFAASAQNFFIVLAKEVLPPTFMVFGTVVLWVIIANIAQVGFVFQGAKIKKGITFEQGLNVVANAKNLFSKHSLAKFVTSLMKVVVITWVAYHWISTDLSLSDRLISTNHELAGLAMGAQIAGKIALLCLIFTMPVVVLDWGLIAAFYIKDNMMGKDEVQREYKESEGDPDVKAHRKSFAREIAESPNRLPSASAVVRNPTHIAVVLRYEPSTAPTPYIIELADGDRAQAIFKQAEELGIPLYTDIPYARGIYFNDNIKVNDFVPLAYSEMTVPFIYWLSKNHPERVFHEAEFAGALTRIGDVKR